MMRDEILALVKRRHEAWVNHDVPALAACHAEAGIVISPMGGVLEGRGEIERVYRQWFSAFPDVRMSMDNVLIDGNLAVEIARMSGTHTGDFFGLAPTGRPLEAKLAMVMTFEDGLILEERRIYDFTGVLIQIGVLKAKPTT